MRTIEQMRADARRMSHLTWPELAATNLVPQMLRDQDALLDVAAKLAEALENARRLSHYAILSEEQSGAHRHGPKKAAQYHAKVVEIEEQMRAALAAWNKMKGEGDAPESTASGV